MIMSCKHAGEIEYDGFVQNEKLEIFTYKALDVTWTKKKLDILPFFQTLSLLSRLFAGLENCWANFKTFSRIQDSGRTLKKSSQVLIVRSTLLSFYISPILLATFVRFKYFYQLSVFDEISAF